MIDAMRQCLSVFHNLSVLHNLAEIALGLREYSNFTSLSSSFTGESTECLRLGIVEYYLPYPSPPTYPPPPPQPQVDFRKCHIIFLLNPRKLVIAKESKVF